MPCIIVTVTKAYPSFMLRWKLFEASALPFCKHQNTVSLIPLKSLFNPSTPQYCSFKHPSKKMVRVGIKREWTIVYCGLKLPVSLAIISTRSRISSYPTPSEPNFVVLKRSMLIWVVKGQMSNIGLRVNSSMFNGHNELNFCRKIHQNRNLDVCIFELNMP